MVIWNEICHKWLANSENVFDNAIVLLNGPCRTEFLSAVYLKRGIKC